MRQCGGRCLLRMPRLFLRGNLFADAQCGVIPQLRIVRLRQIMSRFSNSEVVRCGRVVLSCRRTGPTPCAPMLRPL